MKIDFVELIIVLLIIVFSVILHELAHGIVAYYLGDRTAKDAGRLTFNPIKHIDPYMSILVPVVLYLLKAPVFGGAKPVPINTRNLKWGEWGMALVAAAGPAANLIIAFVAFLIGHFTGAFYGGGISSFIFLRLMVTNIGFMIFNLIPIPPLDGSRILYAISPDAFRNVLVSIERYGFVIVYVIIFLLGDVFSGFMRSGIAGVANFFYLIVGAK